MDGFIVPADSDEWGVSWVQKPRFGLAYVVSCSQEGSKSVDFFRARAMFKVFEVCPCLNFHSFMVGDSIVKKGD
jgi:hypothetical protein